MSSPSSAAKHLLTFSALLAKERDHEIATTKTNVAHLAPTTLQKRGLCLLGMRVSATRTGFAGKLLAEFEKVDGGDLPVHQMRVGDVVGISEGSSKGAVTAKGRGGKKSDGGNADSNEGPVECEGIVTRIEDGRLTVAVKEEGEGGMLGRLCRINKLANDITYKRMADTVTSLTKQVERDTLSPLFQVLLGQRSPSYDDDTDDDLSLFDETLNPSQIEAVKLALRARDVALCHGPPGTGKTYTLVEIVRQLVQRGKRVLVCGPSNISVDNMVERLNRHKLPIVRVGHPARVLPAVLGCTLDYQVKNSDASSLCADIRREIDVNLATLAKTRSRAERKALYLQNRHLRTDLRDREKRNAREIVDGASVVLSTLAGSAGNTVYKAKPFDVLVVDEATQALTPEVWMACRLALKVILAGDPCQLAPTVKSAKGLETTVFDTLRTRDPTSVRLLDTQYRMHEHIGQWASTAMYDGKLKTHDGAKGRTLADLPNVSRTDETSTPLLFIDTAGCEYTESIEEAEEEPSKFNDQEASLVVAYLSLLVGKAGVDPATVAVISPYAAQARLIRHMLVATHPTVEVSSVDGFQGREKDVIVISLVRSNDKGEVGFLKDDRRMNVAITRARRHVCLVGDSETMERGGGLLKGIVDWFFEHGQVLAAQGFDINDKA
ncbi:hypothetical protein HKX48_000367 [Thoreauomyces humboldtii]|nr:hypothetical protein HKX48_000367 [Thoreauomyces humboldtii]